jgi:N-acetyl-gamma-glutamyl-phosphate reductase common form
MSARIGLVGGRGYTGSELLSLIQGHPQMSLAFASSSSQAGVPLEDSCPQWEGGETFCRLGPEGVADHQADAWVLAVPNGKASGWAAAIREAHAEAIILDLSADHRFDESWAYGLPEWNRQAIVSSLNISNPGCYATGAQLGIMPIADYLVEAPVIFGVSGYSGAGRTPSDKNNPARLKDNLMPYSLTGHVHEREISHHIGRNVRFSPHVASFFRGISLTICARVDHEATEEKLLRLFKQTYQDEPRIRVTGAIPEVQAVRETPDTHIGGFAVDKNDSSMFTLVVTLDNLSKGAASQAVQNLNLALGIDEQTGIDDE